jgi:hypothetical protein
LTNTVRLVGAVLRRIAREDVGRDA